MTVPSGGDLAIYDAALTTAEWRVVVGLDYPVWDAQYTTDFATGIDRTAWAHSQLTGPPLTDGSGVHLRGYGEPPFEWLVSRPRVVPVDPALPFQITINATFPQEDPVYDVGFIVGGLDGQFGASSEPLRVIQHGSVTYELFGGTTILYGPSFFPAPTGSPPLVQPFDGNPHEYRVEWRPGAGNPLQVYYDDGLAFEGQGTRPYYIALGIPYYDRREDFPPLGTPEAIVDLVVVHDVTVDQLDTGGFETRVYPGWTTPNDGGGIDTAAPGERFALDGETWARIDPERLHDLTVQSGNDGRADTFGFQLVPPLVDGDDYAWDHWEHRPVLIDTRVTAPSGTTDWRRQIAGRIELADTAIRGGRPPVLTFSGRSIADMKLAQQINATFVQSTEAIPGSAMNFDYDAVFEALAAIGDAMDGTALGDTPVDLALPNTEPLQLGSGARELGAVWAEWADKLVQQSVIRYDIATAPYGERVVHTWDTRVPAAVHEFSASTAEADQTIDARAAAGQVQHHPNMQRRGEALWLARGAPASSVFPSAAYPPRKRSWGDSMAYTWDLAATTLIEFYGRDGTVLTGGISFLRWYAEASRAHLLTIRARNQDWIEIGDGVQYAGNAFVAPAPHIVMGRTLRLSPGAIETTAQCYTTDVIGTVTRGG